MEQAARRQVSRRSSSIPHTSEHLQEPVTRRHLDILGLRQLGAGTSGQAFLVENELDGRSYAVKSVPVHEADGAERTAITNEAAIHSDMHHESIVRYCYSWIDRSPDQATHYFCLLMELCKCDLWSQMEAGVPDREQKIKWSCQLTSGVAHIHSRGVIHRDLGPWNTFVTAVGDVKIGDFGLSARCGPGQELTGSRTPGAVPLDESALSSLYSAPELGTTYGLPADVFSVGMTLYCVWALGEPSCTNLSDVTGVIEDMRKNGRLPEMPQVATFCPFAETLLQMMSLSPEQRPTSQEVEDKVREVLGCGVPASAAQVAQATPAPKGRPSRPASVPKAGRRSARPSAAPGKPSGARPSAAPGKPSGSRPSAAPGKPSGPRPAAALGSPSRPSPPPKAAAKAAQRTPARLTKVAKPKERPTSQQLPLDPSAG